MRKHHFLKFVVDREHEPDEKDWCPPLDRRAALRVLGIGALGTAVGCGAGGTPSSGTGSTSTATAISLAASATSVKVGSSVTLTAMVAPSAATGSVTFYSGTTVLGSATLSSGSAALTTSFSTAQTASVTAVYSGDGSYTGSTSSVLNITVTATVGTTATSTALSVSSTSVTAGASETLTARITPTAATGTVTFYNGTTSLGSGSVTGGIATLTTTFTTAQTASLTAVYSGDSTYAASTSGVVSVAVTSSSSSSSACGTSLPAVTEGPYWLADSASGYNRSLITSDVGGTNTQGGVPLTLTLYVYDLKNSCAAMQNVQVDIWHCNAAGVYSGIKSSTNGNGVDYTSQSWLRGYQLTDSTGMVKFVTIIPGWYNGRTTHIHLRFRSTYNSATDGSANTAQLFFNQTFIDNLDTTVAPYSSEGKNTVTNAGDSIYVSEGGVSLLSPSGSSSAGYSASFSVYLPLT